MNCEYVREHYGVPACIGRRVTVYGEPGIIVADHGNYIGVNFDHDKPSRVLNAHPTDGVVYLEMGVPRKMSRGAARYQRYLEVGECFESFLHFLRYEDAREKGIA